MPSTSGARRSTVDTDCVEECMDQCCNQYCSCCVCDGDDDCCPCCEKLAETCPDSDKCEGRCLQVCVLSLIFVPYTILVFFIAIPWLGFTSWGLVAIGIPTFCGLLVLSSYLKTSYSNPGFVDKEWTNWKAADGKTPLHNVDTSKLKFCKICQIHKPPRAHHCSVTKRCVLKMDHYCPFTANCIGARNQKYFVQFLVYTTMSLAYCVLFMICRAISLRGVEKVPSSIVMILCIGGVFLVPLLFAVGGLAGYHVYLVSYNTTTIESSIIEAQQNRTKREKRRRRRRVSTSADDENSSEEVEIVNAYDIDIVSNWRQVFTPRVNNSHAPLWTAFMPFYKPTPSVREFGYSYPRSKKVDNMGNADSMV